jgi:hypothetical protein
MSAAGKEMIAQKIADSITRTLTRWVMHSIILKWKDNPTAIAQEEKVVDEESDCMLDHKETLIQSSGRLRKQPVARKDDSLWTVCLTNRGY